MGINGHRTEFSVAQNQDNSALLYLEWGFVAVAITLWISSGRLLPWMSVGLGLLIGSTLARWVRMGRFSRRTPLDLPLLVFGVSAIIGLWAAPNQDPAYHRLYLILGAITLYYSIVNSRSGILKYFSLGFVVVTAGLALFFASQHHWGANPARFAITGQIGLILNRIIPDLGLSLPHWNVVRNLMASLVGLALPLAIVPVIKHFIERWWPSDPKKRKVQLHWSPGMLGIIGFAGGFLALGLLLTESRTPWLAGGLLAGTAAWWWLGGKIRGIARTSQAIIFWGGLAAGLILTGAGISQQPGALDRLAALPGPNTLIGRQEIYPQSWLLAQDMPYTGGGLGAFPALYSTYIKVTPYNVFLNEDTGNNAYLNVLVEQGWPGLAALLLILAVPVIAGTTRFRRVHPRYRGFVAAGLLGAGFIILQGFIHATLFSTRAIPAVLIPAGLALAGPEKEGRSNIRSIAPVTVPTLAVFLILAAFGSSFATQRSWRAAWEANLGAIQMGRIDLAGFPADEWTTSGELAWYLEPARHFQRALALDPENTTANFRLGLIEMSAGDYETAIAHLEMANANQPNHRGIWKNLGYSYAWAGKPEQAAVILGSLPESLQELESYQSWWLAQGRPDLAERAAAVARFLRK